MKEIKNRKCLAKKNPEEICVVLANYATGSKKFGQSFGEICSISNLLVFEKFEKNSIGKSENRDFVRQSDFRRQRSQSQQLALSGVGEKKCVCFCLIEFHHDCRR